jgi:hypothetical protein
LSFAASRDRLKGQAVGLLFFICVLVFEQFGPVTPPVGAIFQNPVEQGFFKPDVSPDLLALDPFVAQNFISFCQEFLVEN